MTEIRKGYWDYLYNKTIKDGDKVDYTKLWSNVTTTVKAFSSFTYY